MAEKIVAPVVDAVANTASELIHETTQVIQTNNPFDSTSVLPDFTKVAQNASAHVGVSGTDVGLADHNLVHCSSTVPQIAAATDKDFRVADDFKSCALEVGSEGGNLSKYVFVKHVSWETNRSILYCLEKIDPILAIVESTTSPAAAQTRYFSMIRCGWEIVLQVNAPLGYAGSIMVSYWPPGLASKITVGHHWSSSDVDLSTIFNLPYSILNIATTDNCHLTVPYISHRNYSYITTGAANERCGAFAISVLSPMQTPPGFSTTLSVSVYLKMLEPDFQCPIFVPQGMANPTMQMVAVKHGFGALHGAAVPILKGSVSSGIPNDVVPVDHNTVGMMPEIVDLKQVFQRWFLFNDFKVNQSHRAAQRVVNYTFNFNIGNFCYVNCFNLWRGSIEIKFMCFAPKTVQGRMLASWSFYPGSDYQLENARNTYAMTFDFHGPSAVLKIPYMRRTWMCQVSPHTNIGTLSLFVLNPPVSNSTSSATVDIMMFARAGDDFEVAYPRVAPMRFTAVLAEDWGDEQQLDDDDLEGMVDQVDGMMMDQGLTENLHDVDPVPVYNYSTLDKPVFKESHSSLINLLGRPQRCMVFGPNSVAERRSINFGDTRHLFHVLNCCTYWCGEMVITVRTDGHFAEVSHSWSPIEFGQAAISASVVLGVGGAIIPPNSIVSMKLPYYSEEPFRCTTSTIQWGYLTCLTAGNAQIFISFSELHCYVMRPLPKFLAGNQRSAKCVTGPFSSNQPLYDSRPVPLGYEDPDKVEDPVKRRYSPTNQDQLQNQGIEPNPGPQIVVKDRGIYRHYGLKYGDNVYHVNSENISEAILKGKVAVCTEKFSHDWKPVSENQINFAMEYVKMEALPPLQFSVDDNCESWVYDMVGDHNTETQAQVFRRSLVLVVALAFTMITVHYSNESGLGTKILSFISTLNDLVFGKFECFIVRTVVRTVVRILCYLILYIHHPNLLTTATVGALLALDCMGPDMDGSIKKALQSLISGNFRRFARNLLEMNSTVASDEADSLLGDLDVDEPDFDTSDLQFNNESPDPKMFNSWTLAFKNVQWWFESLVKVFNWFREKIYPSELSEDVLWLKENQDHISLTFALADEHICNMMTDKVYAVDPDSKRRHTALVDTLGGMINKFCNQPRMNPLQHRAQALLTKLQSLTFETTPVWNLRPEPVGIWITGSAGVGKSFLATYIAKMIANHFNWQVYSHPTGSNHMDGYTNQEIHYFDDFGQDRDEEDYKLICQLISSSPFIVPKADLTSKGTYYNAKVVIITTNRTDFSSSKLYDVDALARRFPIKLHIKCKENYSTNGRLDVALAMRSNALKDGSAWQRNLRSNGQINTGTHWVDFNLDNLIQEVCSEIGARVQTANLLNQGPQDIFDKILEPDPIFDFEELERKARKFLWKKPPETKLERFRMVVEALITKLQKFLESNKTWILAMGALASVISMVTMVVKVTKPKTSDSSAYSGGPNYLPVRNYKIDLPNNQGPADFYPIARRMVNLKGPKGTASGLALGGKKVVTYSHDPFDHLVYTNREVNYVATSAVKVLYSNFPTDLQILTFDSCPQQFKTLGNLVYMDDYKGDGYLIWKMQDNFYVQPVSNIRPFRTMVTQEGTHSEFCYMYDAHTSKGSCGGVLFCFIGGAPKILGIHTAGNGLSGCANRIMICSDEGLSNVLKKFDKPLYHQPRRTKYVKSPLYVDSAVEPAVLSKLDPRLLVEVDDVTKLAARKYVGNVFDPPSRVYNAAIIKVGTALNKVLVRSPSVPYEKAISSEFLPIDWTTSPGLKYVGRHKHDLVDDLKFKEDVELQLESPDTIFTTYLKDELRPIEKIQAGKTRAIEAANFDYTIAYRMVMGGIYQQIYADRSAISGLAVGMSPYHDFAAMMDNCYDYVIDLDFKGFDGSLPPQLMETAVDILASFHVDPKLAKKIHMPTIYSKQLVTDELWETIGGMCSGSPCTTVLNSICNNLAAYTVALSCGADYDSINVISYGDDIIISSQHQFPLDNVKRFYKDFFGMTATSADKTDIIEWKPKYSLTFLKRSPKVVHELGSQPIGVLDLRSMMDKIQWCKPKSFDSQLDSFCLELVLHGETVYREVEKDCLQRNSKIHFMPYEVALAKMRDILYCNQSGQMLKSGPNMMSFKLCPSFEEGDDTTQNYEVRETAPTFSLVRQLDLIYSTIEATTGKQPTYELFLQCLHLSDVHAAVVELGKVYPELATPTNYQKLFPSFKNQGLDLDVKIFWPSDCQTELDKDIEASFCYELAEEGAYCDKVAINLFVFKRTIEAEPSIALIEPPTAGQG